MQSALACRRCGDFLWRKGLRDVGDKIVGMLDSDRNANQNRRDSDFAASFLGEPGMHCGRRMADQGFCAAETDRKLEYLKPVERGKCFFLLSFDFKRESRTS